VVIRPRIANPANARLNLNEIKLYSPAGPQIATSQLKVWASSEGNDRWYSVNRCLDGVANEDDCGCATEEWDPNPTFTIVYSCPSGVTQLSKVEVFNRIYGFPEWLAAAQDFKLEFVSASGAVEKAVAFDGVRPLYTFLPPGWLAPGGLCGWYSTCVVQDHRRLRPNLSPIPTPNPLPPVHSRHAYLPGGDQPGQRRQVRPPGPAGGAAGRL
jgi:hypothetical protein